MDCNNCGAVIPPNEEETAGTCYSCQAVLEHPGEEESASVSGIFASEDTISSTRERHPSSGGHAEPRISDEAGPYFRLRVFTGKWEDVWVEAPNVTTARRILFDESDIKPRPISGERSWGRGQEFVLNQARSSKNKGRFDVLPPDIEFFIDRFGRRQLVGPRPYPRTEGE